VTRTTIIIAAACLSLLMVSCQESEPEPACTGQGCVAEMPGSVVGELGQHTDLSIHADGRLVIATYDATHGNLMARVGLPGEEPTTHLIAGWSVGDGGHVDRDSGRWASVTSDASGTSHFSWYEADLGALGYGTLDASGAISSELVDGVEEGDRGTHTSIAVGADGRVVIAYRDEGDRSLRVATRAAGSSTFEVEAVPACTQDADCQTNTQDYGEYASLVLVASQPRVAFYDRARGDLKMALLEDGAWQVVTLDGRDQDTGMDTGDVGRFASAALDSKQRLGIAYFDATRGALRYLSPESTTPHPIVVDRGSYVDELGATRTHVVGQHVALAFDAQGVASLVYLDAGLLALRHIRVYGDTPSSPEVLTTLPPGAFLALERDPSGGLQLAYGAWHLDEGATTTLETASLGWGLNP